MTRTVLSWGLRVAALGSLLLFSVACGGGSKTNAASSNGAEPSESEHVDNCSLVTDAEASTLAGRELKHDEDSFLGCPYVRPGGSNGELGVLGFRGKGTAKENFGNPSSDTTVQEIAGVGDSAAALVRDGHVNFLIVQKENRYVKLVTTFIREMEPGSPKLKEAEALALKAVDRIK